MPDLHDCTNDELVQEVERRLQGNTLGFHGLYSTNQQNWREAWCDVADWVNDMCNADFDRFHPMRQIMCDAIGRHTGTLESSRRQVYAVNTTFHGRSAFEDHAPEQVD